MSETMYLGDGVYLKDDGYHLVLYTSNGEEEKNFIYLDPEVFDNFVKMANVLIGRR